MLRASQGWSQDDAARVVGVSKRTWVRVEAGERALIQEEIEALSLASDASGIWIATGVGRPPTGKTQGLRLRQIRIAYDMDRATLADKLHEPLWKIDAIEADSLPIEDPIALRLSAILGEPPIWFLEGEDEEGEEEGTVSPEDDTLSLYPWRGKPAFGITNLLLHAWGLAGKDLRGLLVEFPTPDVAQNYPHMSFVLWFPTKCPRGSVVVAGPDPHLVTAGHPNPIGQVAGLFLPILH